MLVIGLAVLGVGLGIGKIGGHAMDAIINNQTIGRFKLQCLLLLVLSKGLSFAIIF